MDTKDLLDILDVIKNEELYKQRLEQLKQEHSKLTEAKRIDITLDKAERALAEAEENKKTYEKLIQQQKLATQQEIDRLRSEYDKKAATLKTLENAAMTKQNDANITLSKAEAMMKEALEMRGKFQKRLNDLDFREGEVKTLQNKLREKMLRVQEIVNS